MRKLAHSKDGARSPLRLLQLAVLGFCLLAIVGCTTKNDSAELNATAWEAKTLLQDGKSTDLAEQKSQLNFLRDGTFRWTKGTGFERRTLEGNYELSAGNQVVLILKSEVEGSKTHVATVTVTKDKDGKPTKLVLADDQGTIEFEPKK